MRICFIADGRSPFTQSWIGYLTEAGRHEVHLISTYPCDPFPSPLASLHTAPVAFSRLARAGSVRDAGRNGSSRPAGRALRGLRSGLLAPLVLHSRHWLGPLDVYRYTARVRRIVEQIRPDVVHAMRTQFEGILAAESLAKVDVPLLISIWGNDFTLYARRFPLIGVLARRAMGRANAVHVDCRRDLRLAREWGFASEGAAAVLPSGGGVRTDIFHPGKADDQVLGRWSIPKGAPVVLNARGFRPYVRNDTFFRSIPMVLRSRPDTVFLGVAMEDDPVAEGWVRRLGIGASVRLLPYLAREELARVFRTADVMVSPTEHDGTPNTMLEGMACGVFPVAGDLESVREWVRDGENGLLCDPASPESLAQAVLRALDDEALHSGAVARNLRTIGERADYGKVMVEAERFYTRIARPHAVPSEASP